eukprot:jgi/Mesvir1/493/Mv11364-RA.1
MSSTSIDQAGTIYEPLIMTSAAEPGMAAVDDRDSDDGSTNGFDVTTSNDVTIINADAEEREHSTLVHVPKEDGWRKMAAYVGPGFLIAIAYVDPGNFESDLQAGAQYKYELLWVLLWASVGGLILQALAANLGIVTGKHLAQHCRSEYPPFVNLMLWLFAEVAIIASDVPEVIGSAFALQMLFGLPLWAGVLVTGFDTMIVLAIQRYGIRKLEFLVSALVFVMAICFFIELGHSNPDIKAAVEGIVVPRVSDTESTLLAISIIGAVIMPHNLYLHSALVLSRRTHRTKQGLRAACQYSFVECSLALFIAWLINLAVVGVAASVCSSPTLAPADAAKCADLSLHNTPFLLRNTLGHASEKVFGIALLASGQSSTLTGTFAGQYVMAGFLDLRVAPWLRNMITRMVAIVPSLVVCLVAGNDGAGRLIILASMVLSFQLPYALLPLLKFVNSEGKMGPFKIGPKMRVGTYAITVVVILADLFLFFSAIFSYQRGGDKPRAAVALLTVLAVTFSAFYISSLVYLGLRKDTRVTFTGVSSVAGDENGDTEHPWDCAEREGGGWDPAGDGLPPSNPMAYHVVKEDSYGRAPQPES